MLGYENWNPGLSLTQQKNALIKIADAVYNDAPCYMVNDSNTGIVGSAIPGLDEKKSASAIQEGSKFNPIKVVYNDIKTQSSIMSEEEIKYTTKPKYIGYVQ